MEIQNLLAPAHLVIQRTSFFCGQWVSLIHRQQSRTGDPFHLLIAGSRPVAAPPRLEPRSDGNRGLRDQGGGASHPDIVYDHDRGGVSVQESRGSSRDHVAVPRNCNRRQHEPVIKGDGRCGAMRATRHETQDSTGSIAPSLQTTQGPGTHCSGTGKKNVKGGHPPSVDTSQASARLPASGHHFHPNCPDRLSQPLLIVLSPIYCPLAASIAWCSSSSAARRCVFAASACPPML